MRVNRFNETEAEKAARKAAAAAKRAEAAAAKAAEEAERERHIAWAEEHKLEIALKSVECAMEIIDRDFEKQAECVESIQRQLGRIAEDVGREGDARRRHTWGNYSLYRPHEDGRESMYGAAERVQHSLTWGFANIRWDLLMSSAQRLVYSYRYLASELEAFEALQRDLGVLPVKKEETK